jgi:hypothetical protein
MTLIEINSSGLLNPFDPTDVSGCKLWLRSDLGITLDKLGGVVCWADQSGTGHNFFQHTIANRPIYISSSAALNNLPGLDFTGSPVAFDNVTTDEGAVNTEVISSTAKEYFVVCQADSLQAGTSAWSNDNAGLFSSHSGTYGVYAATIGGVPKAVIGNYDGNFDNLSISFSTATSTLVIHGRHDGVNLNGSLNGQTEPSPVASGTTGVFTGPLAIGRSPQGGAATYFNGRIAEVIAYNAIMTAGERNKIIAYLMHRYNATSSP